MRQSGRPISEYYGELNTIWQELDHRCPKDMTDASYVIRFNDRIEKQRVYMFLVGLDSEFDKEDEAYFTFETSVQGKNLNYEEKSPKTDNGIPISLRSQSFEEENLSPKSEIPNSLTERTEPTLRVYERRNKGKEKQRESVLIQVVQPSSSPSSVR
ncbi:hypothetical protein LWI28_018931 [Acer negundo]|uniref:Retrotransposon gag domain-containing protein n=1 Tax=Acer negundo TaxID=4023 RepID=A0AAD5NM14_ACENE|nr:hypothetical protein LWI28_018931 [Acer negundo]